MAHIVRSAWGIEWKDEFLLDTLLDHDAYTEILEIDGEIVGYFCIFIDKSRVFIASIQVARHYRHCGCGSAMIKRIETIASCSGCERIELWVQVNNENAIGFYEHMGFKIVARQRNNLLMRKYVKQHGRSKLFKGSLQNNGRMLDGRTLA